MIFIENAMSCFDGMSCGQIALNGAGIKYGNYFASEIDRHPIKVTQHNFPDTIQLGDVKNVRAKDLPRIDLLIGGSPCQGFSFAGKQLNFDDPRSKLFFEFVRILKEVRETNPDVIFMLENVMMPKQSEIIISKYLGLEPIVINSNLVSAQNRERFYWTNINATPYNLFGDYIADIPQPKDRKIFLEDILEKDVDEKYFLKDAAVERILRVNKTNFDIPHIVAMQCNERESLAVLSPKRTDYGKKIRKQYEAGEIKEQRKNIQQLEPRNDRKTNTLTSVQKDNLLKVGNRIRRLTELEYERLQTIPEFYTSCVPSTYRYKMIGNSWTVSVIEHIFRFINQKKS